MPGVLLTQRLTTLTANATGAGSGPPAAGWTWTRATVGPGGFTLVTS